MVDMYAKYGSIARVLELFNSMTNKYDLVDCKNKEFWNGVQQNKRRFFLSHIILGNALVDAKSEEIIRQVKTFGPIQQ